MKKLKIKINKAVYLEGVKAGLSKKYCVENPYDPFAQIDYWISWKRGFYDARGYKQ